MTIGVLGGMGALATALFFDKLIALQKVEREQDYVDVLVYNKTSIPDRTAFITGESDRSPLPALRDAARTLREAGCGIVAMPCVTAHFFLPELSEAATMLDMPRLVAQHVNARGHKKVGLLATTGTIQGQFFHRALAEYGVEVIMPVDVAQAKLMEFIYAVKKNALADGLLLKYISRNLLSRGADAVILGCTELCTKSPGDEYIDALEILAQAALAACKGA